MEVRAGGGGTELDVEIDGVGETSSSIVRGDFSVALETLVGGIAWGALRRHSRCLTGTGNIVRMYSSPGTFMITLRYSSGMNPSQILSVAINPHFLQANRYLRPGFPSTRARFEPEITCSSQPFEHTALRPPTSARPDPTRVKWKPSNSRLEKTGRLSSTYGRVSVWPMMSIKGNVVAAHLEISSPSGPQTLVGRTALHAKDNRTVAQ